MRKLTIIFLLASCASAFAGPPPGVPMSYLGNANGVATLDSTAHLNAGQIPTTLATNAALATVSATATAAQTTANAALPATQLGAASGAASLDSTVHIPVAQIPLVALPPSSASTNAIMYKGSSGYLTASSNNHLSWVDSNGDLLIGTQTSLVPSGETAGANVSLAGNLYAESTITEPASGVPDYHNFFQTYVNITSSSAVPVVNLEGDIICQGSGTGAQFSHCVGVNGKAFYSGTGALNYMIGTEGSVGPLAGDTGTVNDMMGIQSYLAGASLASPPTLPELDGIHVQNDNNWTMPITNYYGLILDPITSTGGITNDWAVYSSDTAATSYFAGFLTAGGTSSSAPNFYFKNTAQGGFLGLGSTATIAGGPQESMVYTPTSPVNYSATAPYNTTSLAIDANETSLTNPSTGLCIRTSASAGSPSACISMVPTGVNIATLIFNTRNGSSWQDDVAMTPTGMGIGTDTPNAADELEVNGSVLIDNQLNFASTRKGTFVCTAGGTISISNTLVLATSMIETSLNTLGGTITTSPVQMTNTPGTGFSEKCGTADTSTYNYVVMN